MVSVACHQSCPGGKRTYCLEYAKNMGKGSVTSFWGFRNGGRLSGRGFLKKLLLELISQEMGLEERDQKGSLTEETKARGRNQVAGVMAC